MGASFATVGVGALSVDCERGTWFDHEAGEGGGVLALVERECGSDRAGAIAWLRERGFLEGSEDRVRDFRPLPAAPAPAPSPSPSPASATAAERARTALVAAIWSAGRFGVLDASAGVFEVPGRVVGSCGVDAGGVAVVAAIGGSAHLARCALVRSSSRGMRSCGVRVVAGPDRLPRSRSRRWGSTRGCWSERWRRTCGRRAGAVFWARRDAGAGVVHAAEGEIDALAVALLCDGEVMGVGGTSGFVNVAELVGAHRSVVLHADCGRGGERAAVKGLAGLRARGVRARVQWYARDPAAEFEEGA